jgi:2-oxoglutarate ferredoxin oxidoreductase subunit delta
MARIEVDDDLCKGCGICIEYCPPKVIELADRISLKGYHPATLKDDDGCTGCAICGKVCPDLAIEVYR